MYFPDNVNRIVTLAPGASLIPFSWPILLLLRVLPYIPVKPNPLKKFFNDKELLSIHTPTLFLAGENEVVYDPVAAIDRANKLMPNVQTHLIPNAGHLLAMEQPELVNELILSFLR